MSYRSTRGCARIGWIFQHWYTLKCLAFCYLFDYREVYSIACFSKVDKEGNGWFAILLWAIRCATTIFALLLSFSCLTIGWRMDSLRMQQYHGTASITSMDSYTHNATRSLDSLYDDSIYNTPSFTTYLNGWMSCGTQLLNLYKMWMALWELWL